MCGNKSLDLSTLLLFLGGHVWIETALGKQPETCRYKFVETLHDIMGEGIEGAICVLESMLFWDILHLTSSNSWYEARYVWKCVSLLNEDFYNFP